ncbi:MAG: glycosyltransferase [Pseudomonadota bacterium]|nr:glycosyltransferase [Pseudomonadota bacterium]
MKYSVVIPTFNRREKLVEAIDSVLRQRYADIEIIVVDDGSDDDSCKMLAQRFPEVHALQQANQGPAAARNRGIAAAKGEWIAFLDSDDIWLEHKIERELDLFKRFPEAALLAGNASSLVEGTLRSADTFAQRQIPFVDQQPRYFDWSLPIMKLGPTCCMSAMVFRLDALRMLGAHPFNERLRLDEDWDLEFRFFARFKALLYPDIACHRRVFHDDTRHHYSAAGQIKSAAEQRTIWQQQRDIIARYLDVSAWDAETRAGFLQRHRELGALLQKLEHGEEPAESRL